MSTSAKHRRRSRTRVGRSWSTEIASESTPAIAGPEQRDQHRQRPEEEPERAERSGKRSRAAPHRARAARRRRRRAGGVDVGAERSDARRRPGRSPGETTFCEARRKNRRAEQVEAVVEVEVHRGRREQHEPEAERRDRDRDQAAGEAEQAVGRVDEPDTAGGRRSARPRPGGRVSRSRSASRFAARRSASVPASRPSNEHSSRMISMRPAHVHARGLSRGTALSASGPMCRSMSATESRRATEIVQRFIWRHSTPTLSQYSQNRSRMSSERLVNL